MELNDAASSGSGSGRTRMPELRLLAMQQHLSVSHLALIAAIRLINRHNCAKVRAFLSLINITKQVSCERQFRKLQDKDEKI